MPVTATIDLHVSGKHTGTADHGTPTFPFNLEIEHALTSGVASGMVDKVFSDQRTLAASAAESLDLAGVLTDSLGATVTFVTIKAVIIRAVAGNTNDVQVTRPASNGAPIFMAAGDGIALKPGYTFAWFGPGTGVTVTPATGDLLTLTNSAGGTGVTYDIIILGTSA